MRQPWRSMIDGRQLPGGVMAQIRSNPQIEAAVNRGLALANSKGWLAGADQMNKEGVPFHVAARVMLFPKLRRATDWKARGSH